MCEDGSESSAELSRLGFLCQAGAHVLCSMGKPQRGISFWRGERYILFYFYFLTFHIEITSDFQNHCRTSTKIFYILSTHFPQVLTSCMRTDKYKKKKKLSIIEQDFESLLGFSRILAT